MASATADKLATMSLSSAQSVSHGPCNNLPEWKAQLETVSGLPASYTLTKTLVFKPSTAPSFDSPPPLVNLFWNCRDPQVADRHSRRPHCP